ncbi:MAG: DUF5915 domain-containing protein [Christensenellales bacterium]
MGKAWARSAKLLAETDGGAAVAAFERGESLVLNLDGEEITLSRDDVLVETAQKEGLVSLEERGVTVALDTVLNDELISEGYAREVISKLQTMRKDAGFEVTDRVHVRYEADTLKCPGP